MAKVERKRRSKSILSKRTKARISREKKAPARKSQKRKATSKTSSALPKKLRKAAAVGVREIDAKKISDTVAELCMAANFELEEDVLRAIEQGSKREESEVGKEIFRQILENAQIARSEKLPICQDTGLAVVFVEVGQDVHIKGAALEEAIDAGVRRGYTEGYLRKSVLGDPIKRVNTKDNTPAVVHARIVPGGKIRIWVAPKGGGSENKSRIAMLKPADGVEGVKKFVLETVRIASADPCPPIVVGVGIGGSFEQCAFISKKALLRSIGSSHPDPFYADLERALLLQINNLGIGPQGLGGRVTALAVHIETAPCHIASLPVAVNLNCHAARHKMAEL